MKDIYLKLKKELNDKEIIYNKEHNFITIKWEEYEVSVDDDKIDLYYKNKPYDHSHPKDNKEILLIINNFLENADHIVYEIDKKNKRTWILLIIFILLLIIAQLFLYFTNR